MYILLPAVRAWLPFGGWSIRACERGGPMDEEEEEEEEEEEGDMIMIIYTCY